MRILSLGAGVQSTTVLFMALDGVIPPIDAAIFADTGAEPKKVYEHLCYLERCCEDAGVPLHIVSAGNLKEDLIESAFAIQNLGLPPCEFGHLWVGALFDLGDCASLEQAIQLVRDPAELLLIDGSGKNEHLLADAAILKYQDHQAERILGQDQLGVLKSGTRRMWRRHQRC